MALALAFPRRALPLALALGGAAVAALLAWLCVGVNFERACVTQDTPYLPVCALPAPGSPAQRAALLARIAANPGDANAFVQLAVADRSAQRDHLLDAAARLAPNQSGLLLAQAAAALERQDWPHAVLPLIQLVEYRDAQRPAAILGQLIAGGQGPLLAPYLTPGSHWLGRVLAQLPHVPSAVSAALPLVVQASRVGVLEPELARSYVRDLKAAGAWADAYSLWLALRGKAAGVLHNPGFDLPFEPDGFDWEVGASGPPGRIGAIVERKNAQARGSILEIRFTGRAFAVPLVRQYLFLGEGRWRLRGDYSARQLRMEQGLAWAVQCTAAASQAGRSAALADTAGSWQRFAFEFAIPGGCGLVSSLQLEAFAPFEAALGARGQIAFDNFSLEKLP